MQIIAKHLLHITELYIFRNAVLCSLPATWYKLSKSCFQGYQLILQKKPLFVTCKATWSFICSPWNEWHSCYGKKRKKNLATKKNEEKAKSCLQLFSCHFPCLLQCFGGRGPAPRKKQDKVVITSTKTTYKNTFYHECNKL